MPNLPEDNAKTTKNFPYKTLIWAVFALVAIFLFKPELKILLTKADEVSIFGIELKVGKDDANKLENAIQGYKDKIADFNKQMTQQQERIKGLESLKNDLQADLAQCPQASESARTLNLQFDKVLDANTRLQNQSEVLKNTKILKRMSAVSTEGGQ